MSNPLRSPLADPDNEIQMQSRLVHAVSSATTRLSHFGTLLAPLRLHPVGVLVWLLLWGLFADTRVTQAQAHSPTIIRVHTSKPVIDNGAQFVATVQKEWRVTRPGASESSIEIQLGITNLSKADAAFPTFDTFSLSLIRQDNSAVKMSGGRDGSVLTNTIVLAPGASYAICRRAQLQWDRTAGRGRLAYFDGTGAEWYFSDLDPGTYKLRFLYGTTHLRGHSAYPAGAPQPYWLGKISTADVEFKVLGP